VIEFRRTFGQGELAEWEEMLTEMRCVSIQEGRDGIRWCLEKSGQYTTRSMYRFLVHRGVLNMHMQRVWKARLPMKLKVFMWQVFQDKLQKGEGGLKKPKWKGDGNCMVCGVTETRDHILFVCPIAKFTSSCFREASGWVKSLRGFQNCLDGWFPLGCVDYKLKIFVLGVALWVLWNTRNKL
jgi:rubrerythrin